MGTDVTEKWDWEYSVGMGWEWFDGTGNGIGTRNSFLHTSSSGSHRNASQRIAHIHANTSTVLQSTRYFCITMPKCVTLPTSFIGMRTMFYSQYKKLSYRRDSAGWWSLRLSRSFKVTDFCTSQKLVCDFLWVNTTKLDPISHRLP